MQGLSQQENPFIFKEIFWVMHIITLKILSNSLSYEILIYLQKVHKK